MDEIGGALPGEREQATTPRSLRIVPSLPNRGPSSPADRSGIGAIESPPLPPLRFEASVITGPADLSPLSPPLSSSTAAGTIVLHITDQKNPISTDVCFRKIIYSVKPVDDPFFFRFFRTRACARGTNEVIYDREFLRRVENQYPFSIVFFFSFAWVDRVSLLISLFLSSVRSKTRSNGKSNAISEENPLRSKRV